MQHENNLRDCQSRFLSAIPSPGINNWANLANTIRRNKDIDLRVHIKFQMVFLQKASTENLPCFPEGIFSV